MPKKFVGLAILAVASNVAIAQSNVTIYGNIDMGYMIRQGSNGLIESNDRQRDFQQAGSQSYVGFKGIEDLGNGLKAIFDLAYLIDPDTNSGMNKSAHQLVGLTGNFGTVVGGYVDGLRFGIWGKHDPFTNYSVGSFQQMSAHFDRAQNAVVYISPSFSGLTLIAGQTTHTLGNEGTGLPGVWAGGDDNKGDTRLTALGFSYVNGPLAVDGSYEFANQVKEPGNDERLYVVDLAATYNFEVAKVHMILDKIQGDENSALGYLEGLNNAGVNKRHHKRNVMLGLTVPLNGKTNLLASYGLAKDKVNDNADASKWSVGATYALSKRTQLYAAYSQINNDNNSGYAISPMGNSAGACLGNERAAVTCDGFGTKGLAMGMKHSF